MTSSRRFTANRLNAQRSTGPRTIEGKLRSRRNAVRHGLTARTIVADSDELDAYHAFEDKLLMDFLPSSGIQRELVERLASLLWRLRRVTDIENGLLAIQQKIARECTPEADNPAQLSASDLRSIIGPQPPSDAKNNDARPTLDSFSAIACERSHEENVCASKNEWNTSPDAPIGSVALAFLRLANLDNQILERLGRYETRLWRQAAQTLLLIGSITKNDD